MRSSGYASHKAFEPDKPFFMYWASGAIHGPHHIMKEWADKYKDKFDDGWDNYRERVFKRAKAKGWIPTEYAANATAADDGLLGQHPRKRKAVSAPPDGSGRDSVNMSIRRPAALMDEVDRLGYGDNTLVFYIWGDNGSSAEGQNGTISELLAQNGIPTTSRNNQSDERARRA